MSVSAFRRTPDRASLWRIRQDSRALAGRTCNLHSLHASAVLIPTELHPRVASGPSSLFHEPCGSLKIEQQLPHYSYPYLKDSCDPPAVLLRKEVIQPHLPIRLPCYDLTPVTGPAFGSSLLAVGSLTSGITNSHGLTGGVYKTRERIHRDMLIRDY